MQRLLNASLLGLLIGFVAALWLPPGRLEGWTDLTGAVQAQAQTFFPQPGAPAPAAALPASVVAPRPSSSPAAATAVSEPVASADPRPGGAAESNWPVRPSAEEGAYVSAEINQFESARIIARVGGDWVLAGEVLPAVNELLAPYADKMPADQFEAQRLALINKQLGRLIETKVVVADARRKIPPENWKVIQDRLSGQFETTELPKLFQRTRTASRADLVSRLQQLGTTLEAEQRAFVERTLARQWIYQQINQDEEIPHEDIVAYYREHLEDYALPAKARWDELAIRADGASAKAEAFRKIAEMGNQVLAGALWGDVARRSSQGSTAAEGGSRDWTTEGSLVSQVLDRALFEMPIGEPSPILEDAQGFHIVRVVERQEAGRVPFEEAQVEIRTKIRTDRRKAQVQQYLDRVTRETDVWTIFDDARPEEQLTDRPASNPRR